MDSYYAVRKNSFRMLSMTNWLIMLNFVCFFIFYFLCLGFGEDKVFGFLALQPNLFFSGRVWTAFTSIFLHGGIAHLVFNMISLFFIGNFVEKIIGRKRFLIFYLVSGIFSGVFYVSLSYFFGYGLLEKIFISPNVFAVGASGAIFALLGLLAVLTPYNKVYLITGPLLAIIFETIFSSLFSDSSLIPIINIIVTVYFLIAIFSMFSFNSRLRKISLPVEMPFWILPIFAIVPLVIIGLFFPLPIGNTAHLGGLIAGFIYAFYLKIKYKRKTEMLKKAFV